MRCAANCGWVVVCVAWMALCCSGCKRGSGDAPELGTVSGTVTWDGKPLANADVQFSPQTGRPSTGTTDANGKYQLLYTQDQPGAKVGKHTVRITTEKYTEKENGETVVTAEILPPKYHANSELVEEVKPGGNTIDFDLKSE